MPASATPHTVALPPTTVADVMARRVVTVEFDDRLEEVQEIIERLAIHHVLVVEDGALFGVVSDRDLLRGISPYIGSTVETDRDLASLNKRVHQVMSRHPVAVAPETALAEAAQLLLGHGISCLPVVDGQRRPVGLVTWRDLLRAAYPA